MTKNMPKWLSILCVGVFMTCFCMICMFICTRPRDVKDTIAPVEDNSTEELGDLIEVNSYLNLFKGDIDIDNYYLIGNTGYHIVISDNTVTVNSNVIFKADKTIYTVDLYKDMFIIYTANDSSNFKSTLYLIGLEGNVIKKVDNVILEYRNFYQEKISYVVDNYDYGKSLDNDVIYKYHPATHYMITYLGSSQISEEIDEHSYYIYTPQCLDDKCVLYEQDGLKIEIGYTMDADQQGNKFRTRGLFVNGNKVQNASELLNISFLPDGYLFMTSSYQDGFTEHARIVDWNGNTVTDFSDIVGDDFYSSHPLTSDTSNSFSNGTFYINTVSGKAQREIGQYFEGHDVFSNDYLVGRIWTFNYLGNGQVDDGYIIDNITVGDFNEYIKSKAQ